MPENQNLTLADFGPFSDKSFKDSHLKKYLNDTFHFVIEYKIETSIPSEAPSNANYYRWTVLQHFGFSTRAVVQLRLQTQRVTLEKFYENAFERYYWIHFLVLIFSSVSLALGVKYVFEIYKMYQ